MVGKAGHAACGYEAGGLQVGRTTAPFPMWQGTGGLSNFWALSTLQHCLLEVPPKLDIQVSTPACPSPLPTCLPENPFGDPIASQASLVQNGTLESSLHHCFSPRLSGLLSGTLHPPSALILLSPSPPISTKYQESSHLLPPSWLLSWPYPSCIPCCGLLTCLPASVLPPPQSRIDLGTHLWLPVAAGRKQPWSVLNKPLEP